MKRATLNAACAGLLASAVGCGAGGATEIPSDMNAGSAEFRQQAEDIVNRYARALADRDADAIQSLVSTEVRDRFGTYEGGINRFIEKQRTALLKTASVEGEVGLFKVKSAARQEGSVAVTLTRDGVDVPRPTYFVLEGSAYKLNIAPQGFSRPLPPGAAANDNYWVRNTDDLNGPVWAACYLGTSAEVPGLQTVDFSCPNTCGFFHGAYFDGTRWTGTHYCDYHWAAVDVLYQGFIGMYCTDPC